MAKFFYLAPISLFLVIAIYFAAGLGRDPAYMPSMLIDRPAPQFDLPGLTDDAPRFTSDDLNGEVSLVNIFGSWCIACEVEHPTLMRIAASDAVPIYGIDWRDKPGAGAAWLSRHGDPYTKVGDDASGRVAIDFGVTGAPETFVIDREGRVRHKHVGIVTPEIWENVLLPMIEDLRADETAAG